MIFYFIILLLIIITIILEIERNFIISYNFNDYYIKNFPKQTIKYIYNFFFKIYSGKVIFNVDNKKFNKFLIKNKINIINEYLNSDINKISINAHETTNMFKKDNSYKYIIFKSHTIPKKNLKSFPTIEILLNNHPEIETCFLSIMKKKIIIPYHRGPTNRILRYHFPLIVNDIDKCFMEIMGKKIYYNKPFAFDDTYPHMLKKIDNSLKLVLICDIKNSYIINY